MKQPFFSQEFLCNHTRHEKGKILHHEEDEFVNGNEIDWWFEIEEEEDSDIKPLTTGDVIDINFFGISKGYYNYLFVLISQSEDQGPFNTTPVALKGNCVNLTTPANYANGYFRITQVVKTSYTVE